MNKMTIKIYHTVGTITTSISKIIETEVRSISLSHIYMTAHFLNPITYILDGISPSHIYMTAHFLNPITYIHDGSLS